MQNGNEFMHVYARPPAGRGRSPTNSPPNSPRCRYGRVKNGRFPGASGGPHSRPYFLRLMSLFFSYVLRRHAVLLLFPVIYISGMLLYMGTMSRDMQVPPTMLPGSVYRSREVFENIWPAMETSNVSFGSFGGVERAWEAVDKAPWKPCFSGPRFPGGLPESNGYIVVEANGGLNQQRTSICNAVAVAQMLNATLVIPRFHLNSVWNDNSTFGEIYDEKHFIDSLEYDVGIVNKLPDEIMKSFGNLSNVYNFNVKAWAPADFYLEKVLPKLQSTGVVRFTPFANRLSFDNIPLNVQQLRCRTNFEALRFAEPIRSLGDILLRRMISQSSNSNGKFIGVHLRFEKDMVAFSCCSYDGGERERIEMDAAREKGWRGKFTRRGRSINPGGNRRDGKCPLTPLEVGMILRGMGFSNTTPIYLASGRIYEGNKTLPPLQQMFPFLHTKETLLSGEELEPLRDRGYSLGHLVDGKTTRDGDSGVVMLFCGIIVEDSSLGHSSRMAALDYTVCLHSEVFVSTQGGNFPQILMGHRRFLNKGHARTIRPDKRKLALVLDNPNITWEALSQQLQAMRVHSDQKGHELRKPNASIYTFPAPECMCCVDEPPVNEILDNSKRTLAINITYHHL